MKIIYVIGVVLSGMLTDGNTNEPLCGVEIEINGKSTYSDLDGKFTISDYESDTINFSYISYSDTTIILDKTTLSNVN